MTEEAIYQGIASKDDKTFAFMYQHYFPQIQSLILKNSGNCDDANDIFQEGLVQLWINIQKESFQLKETTKISTYLYTVCRNLWISKLRKAKRTVPLDSQSFSIEEELQIDELFQSQRIEALRQNFQKLGDKCKQLLTLFYYEKESLRNIAKIMDYEEKTAKNNKYRCMQKLRSITLS